MNSVKLNATLVVIFFFKFHSIAQKDSVKGKVVYQVISPSGTNKIMEMWFNDSMYLYQYKTTDVRDYPIFKDKKYNSIKDSLDDIKKITVLNMGMTKTPKQSWFGYLSSDTLFGATSDSYGKQYCIQDIPGFVKWELLNDTMTIMGLKCKKANGVYKEAKYTAWYTTEIPVSIAPLQLRGLPGLLLKVRNNTNPVDLVVTDLEWPIKVASTIAPCQGPTYITKEEMKNIMESQKEEIKKILDSYEKNLKKGE